MHALRLWVLHALACDSRSFLLFSACLLSGSGDFISPFRVTFFSSLEWKIVVVSFGTYSLV